MSNAPTKGTASVQLTRSEQGRELLSFRNQFWLLEIELHPTINPRMLKHLSTGKILADEDYCYSVDLASATARKTGFHRGPQSARSAHLLTWDVETEEGSASTTLCVQGRLDFGTTGPTDIIIEHRFTLSEVDRFDEQITLVHRFAHDEHEVSDYRFGFRKQMFDARGARWLDHADGYRLGAIPFRRRRGHAKDYLMEDYSAADIVPANWEGNNQPNRQAEAWSWGDTDGGFCFTKYCQEHIEFALVDAEFYDSPDSAPLNGMAPLAEVGDVSLRFLGAGRTHGAPGIPVIIGAKSPVFRFGTSSILPFTGDWREGHKAYGAHLRAMGHTTPKGFNPPVHWNELYNLGWRGMNSPLQELPELWEEAGVAQAMGAEAFYFDPVWDTYDGSTVWDSARLGPLTDFVGRLKKDFGLSLSLHLMMHIKSAEDDPRIYRRSQDGEIIEDGGGDYTGGYACCASDAWVQVKTDRLLELGRAGVKFFMFDFCEYALPGTGGVNRCEACWDPTHGHSVPATLEEHASGLAKVMKAVKREFPDLLIEAHDAVTAGFQDYLPLYYGHNYDGVSFDELWGFEFMWNPYMDLLSGKALSLYEYNIAFDIPLYLHVNLRFDNDNALAFWWYASMCRHLGIGGLTPSDAIWGSHQRAMKTYLRLKPHFSRGRFVGMDTLVHGHVLDEERSAVIVVFNLSSKESAVSRSFSLDELGLPADLSFRSVGAQAQNGVLTIEANLPPLSSQLFELEW